MKHVIGYVLVALVSFSVAGWIHTNKAKTPQDLPNRPVSFTLDPIRVVVDHRIVVPQHSTPSSGYYQHQPARIEHEHRSEPSHYAAEFASRDRAPQHPDAADDGYEPAPIPHDYPPAARTVRNDDYEPAPIPHDYKPEPTPAILIVNGSSIPPTQ